MSGQQPNFGGGMGGFAPPGGESMNESTIKSMTNGTNNGTNSSGGSNSNSIKGSQSGGLSNQNISKKPIEPREVSSIQNEVSRAGSDVWDEVKNFFSINTWLGIDPDNMNPEEEAKAKEFHARYQQLDQQQQAVAKQMYQKRMQEKKIREEEEMRKKKVEAQNKEQAFSMPTGPQRGAQAQGGSNKQRVMQKLKQDRTTIGTTQGE